MAELICAVQEGGRCAEGEAGLCVSGNVFWLLIVVVAHPPRHTATNL